MVNPVLKAIKNRRSSLRFKSTPIDEEKLNTVLEAGRWAPSWTNTQPWKFIVVRDTETKKELSTAVSTIFSLSLKEAPVCIAVCVNTKKDAFHFIEDGAIATQNMALAAQSLELSTSWIGTLSLSDEKNSTERKLMKILGIPKNWRLISLLPLGVPRFKENKNRKELSEIVDFNHFMNKETPESNLERMNKSTNEIPKIPEPVSARELEGALV
jgi:nitroreductase